MKNNRIIVLLKSLNKREFNRFVLYVKSPFFNQSARLVKLINYLASIYPDFPPKLISKEILFKKLYGSKESFEDQKIHDQLSQLLKLFEGFLAQLQLKEQPEKAELQLLDALKQRNLDKQFQRVYRRMEERLNRVDNKNPDFFLSHFHMLER